jgi:hemoglobin
MASSRLPLSLVAPARGRFRIQGKRRLAATRKCNDMSNIESRPYGTGDASFLAAGGVDGLRRLVDNFFDRMGSDGRFATIYAMHPEDKTVSRDKLARFLCGWLGGPKLYNEKYGAIGIPRVHAHLPIGMAERNQWLTCMSESVEEQAFATDFKTYLMEQLFVPAEAVRRRCATNVESDQ